MIVESIHYIKYSTTILRYRQNNPPAQGKGIKKQVNGLTNQSFYNIVCNLLVL